MNPLIKRDVVTVDRFFREKGETLALRLAAGKTGLSRIIREPTVNRPGLALAGHNRYFASRRVQVVGSAEHTYLQTLKLPERARRLRKLFAFKIPCVVFCRELNPDDQFIELANEAGVPVFTCPLITMKFINQATIALESMFAPRAAEMGSMVDILGVGVIIRGESGIGKSECVLALIERGYSLVADDVTKVTLLDGKEVMGTSSELTRDHMEVRGIGIINVLTMFGVRSVRQEKRVDVVVTLKEWDEVPNVDRLGMEDQYIKILGVDIPNIIIPVRPGRDLARLVEVAAMHIKLRGSGYNAAKELDRRLIHTMTQGKNA